MEEAERKAAGGTRPVVAVAALCALVGLAPPTAWLVGAPPPEVEGALEAGAWTWRMAWPALGLFLFLTRRAGRAPGAAGAESLVATLRGGGWVLAVPCLLALLVRLPGLDGQLWFDEVWMLADFVRPPLGDALRRFPTDNHHPLYTALAWGSVRVFGEHAWALRLPALAFGVACVPALYALAERLVGRRAALLACALLALSYHHVQYSQNARGYTALACFALLSCHGFLEALRGGGRRAWLLQGTALALGTWAHTTGVFVGVGQLLTWLLVARGVRGRRGAPLLGLAYGAVLSLALHALMLPQMVRFFLLREDRVAVEAEWTSPWWTLVEVARSFGLGAAAGFAVLGAGVAVAALGLARLWRARPAAALVSVLPAAALALALVLAGRNLWPRMFFFASGFALLFAATGLEGLRRWVRGCRFEPGSVRTPAATALLAICLLAWAALLPRAWALPKQDYEGARAWVEAARGPGDAVLTVGLAGFPYEVYYGGGFRQVDEVEALEDALPAHGVAYVLSTFPIYLRSRHAALARWLDEHAEEAARFPGSVGGGDLVVLRVER